MEILSSSFSAHKTEFSGMKPEVSAKPCLKGFKMSEVVETAVINNVLSVSPPSPRAGRRDLLAVPVAMSKTPEGRSRANSLMDE